MKQIGLKLKKYLSIKSFNIVVQINGKKRDLLNVDKSLEEKEILKLINKNEKINKFLEIKKLRKLFMLKIN